MPLKMADDWENEDYDLPPPPVVVKSDRWEGEDEEEPVKESWEDEETEAKETKPVTTGAPAKKKSSKKLEEKIAEKERKLKEEAELRRQMEEENMTPEEKAAEKLRRQKLVEAADFELAKETFGVSSSSYRGGSIDDADPTTKEQFTELRNNLVKKMQSLSLKEQFNDFMEELIKDFCVGLDVEVLKKVSATTKSLHEEKLRMAKALAKGGKKGKTKVVLKMDKETDLYGDDFAGGGDYDDFM
nr:EOG090X0OQM [Sida crystallina]